MSLSHTMRRAARMAAALLLLLALAVTHTDAACGTREDGTPIVNCKACSKTGLDAAINDMAGVPRVNLKAASISKDLGDYTLYSCEGAEGSEERECSFKTEVDTAKIISQSGDQEDPKGITNYIQGYLPHIGFALLLAILCIVGGFVLLCSRYCCCCCGRLRCIGGCCGARFPTQKADKSASCPRRWCACGGMEPTEDGLAGKPDAMRWAYTKRDKIGTLVFFVGFVFCVFLFVGLGFFSGVRALPNKMASVVNDSPASVLSLVAGTRGPLGDFLSGLASETMVGLLEDMRATFAEVVTLSDVVDRTDCVLNNIVGLPTTRGLELFVSGSQDKLKIFVERVAGVGPALDSDIHLQQANVAAGLNTLLLEPMLAVQTAVSAARNGTVATRDLLANFDALLANVTTSTRSAAPSVRSDFDDMSDVPSVATTSALTTAGPPTSSPGFLSLKSLWDSSQPTTNQHPLSGVIPSDQLQNLVSKLDSAIATYTALPDYSVSAERLRNIDGQLAFFHSARVIDNLLLSISDTTDKLRNLESLVFLLQNATESFTPSTIFNLTMEYTLVRSLNATLYDPRYIPDFTALRGEVNLLIDPLHAYILPCLEDLFGYISAINASLIALPPEMNVAGDILVNINTTSNDARASIEEVITSLSEFDQKRADLNLTNFLQKLDEIQSQVNAQGVGNSTAFDSLGRALNATRQINFTSLVEQVKAFNDSIGANRIADTNTVASDLDAFQASKSSILTNLTLVRTDTNAIDLSGLCTSDSSVCTSDATCGAGTCAFTYKGQRRCMIAQAVSCPSASSGPDTTCTGTGDRCLVNADRITNLISSLDSLAANAPTLRDKVQGASVTGQLTAINLASSVISTTRIQSQLLDATNQLAATNTSDFFEELDKITAQFDKFNSTALNDQVNELNATISGIDYTDVNEQITELNSTLTDVQTNQVTPLRDARQLIYTFQQLMDVKFPEYSSRLSPAALGSIRASEGVSGMLLAVVQIADDATVFLGENQNLLNISSDLVNSTRDIRELIDIILAEGVQGREAQEHGSIYTLMRVGALGNQEDYLQPDDPDWGSRKLYEEDASGNSYADGRKCITQECIETTITTMLGGRNGGGRTIQDLSGGSIPAPVTREQVQALPLILPVLVVLVALIATALFKHTKWASACFGCSICLALPFAALLFLLSALMFPALIAYSDLCYGMENVGEQYVRAQGNEVCTSTISGTGTAQECQVETFNGTTLTMNVPAVYMGIMGGRCAQGEDAIAPMWASFQASVERYPENMVNGFLDDQAAEGGDLQVKPRLQGPVREAARGGGAHFKDFVGAIGAQSLSCKSLNKMWKDVKAPICCGVGTALYWSLGSIYLLAFSLLCCGVPSMLQARKRFPAKPWGPFATDTDPAYAKFPASLSAIPGVDLPERGGWGEDVDSNPLNGMMPGEGDDGSGGMGLQPVVPMDDVVVEGDGGAPLHVRYGPTGGDDVSFSPTGGAGYAGNPEAGEAPLVPHLIPSTESPRQGDELTPAGIEMASYRASASGGGGSARVAHYPGAGEHSIDMERPRSDSEAAAQSAHVGQVDAEPLPLSPSVADASGMASPSRGEPLQPYPVVTRQDDDDE